MLMQKCLAVQSIMNWDVLNRSYPTEARPRSQPDILILPAYGYQIEMSGCDGFLRSIPCKRLTPTAYMDAGRERLSYPAIERKAYFNIYLLGGSLATMTGL